MQLPQLFDRITTPFVTCGMLSKVVKELREERRLSQAELAKLAGVSQQLIAKIEKGTARETKKLPGIAAALGLTVEELIARMHGVGARRGVSDPQLARLLQCWPELTTTAKEHVVQSAEFARSQSTYPFRKPTDRHAVHERKSTYSSVTGRRVRRQGE